MFCVFDAMMIFVFRFSFATDKCHLINFSKDHVTPTGSKQQSLRWTLIEIVGDHVRRQSLNLLMSFIIYSCKLMSGD